MFELGPWSIWSTCGRSDPWPNNHAAGFFSAGYNDQLWCGSQYQTGADWVPYQGAASAPWWAIEFQEGDGYPGSPSHMLPNTKYRRPIVPGDLSDVPLPNWVLKPGHGVGLPNDWFEPVPFPQLDPHSRNPGQPQLDIPLPLRGLPLRQPNPNRSPAEQPQWGPQSPSRPLPWEQPVIRSRPFPGISFDWSPAPRQPQPTPYDEPRTRPVPGGSLQPPSPSPLPAPPAENVKERKVSLKIKGIAAKLIGAVTEGLDSLSCAWKALPDQYKPGYYPLHRRDGTVYYKRRFHVDTKARAQAVYTHFDKVDLNKMVNCMAMQDLSDMAWAKLGKAAGRGGARIGMNRGLQFGPWDTAGGEAGRDAAAAQRIARERSQTRLDRQRRAERKAKHKRNQAFRNWSNRA